MTVHALQLQDLRAIGFGEFAALNTDACGRVVQRQQKIAKQIEREQAVNVRISDESILASSVAPVSIAKRNGPRPFTITSTAGSGPRNSIGASTPGTSCAAAAIGSASARSSARINISSTRRQ